MRIFVALDIDDDIRARIQHFVDGVAGFAPDSRWVNAQSLHITLKFIGEQPQSTLPAIENALSAVKSEPFQIKLRGHGFFPNPNRPRTFWIGIDADSRLPALAAAIVEALISLRIPKEAHGFTPHITLARSRGGMRNRDRKISDDGPFHKLREKLEAFRDPEFGTMTAREFFLYESRPSSHGSVYTKIARFPLP